MNDVYQFNQFGEVARYICGRETHERRPATDFEEQLSTEIEELETEVEELEKEVEKLESFEEKATMWMRCLNRLEDYIQDRGLLEDFKAWKVENKR